MSHGIGGNPGLERHCGWVSQPFLWASVFSTIKGLEWPLPTSMDSSGSPIGHELLQLKSDGDWAGRACLGMRERYCLSGSPHQPEVLRLTVQSYL